MVGLKYSFLIVFLMSITAVASDEKIDIKNQLSQCSEIRNPKIIAEGSVPILSFDLVLNKSIADCGCKSALGAFSVYAQRDGAESYLINGKLALGKEGKKFIPVAADNNLISAARLMVSFSCAQPD
jgi:hypothetical protein